LILSKGGLRECPKRTSSLPCENGYKREKNKQKFAGHQRNLDSDYRKVLLLPDGLLNYIRSRQFLHLICVSLEPRLAQEDLGSSQVLLQSERVRETLNLLIHFNLLGAEGGQGDSPFDE
jgi:hypothetical protein